MIDDICDYLTGEGIYHHPYFDGEQHRVAGLKLTTSELCTKAKKILDEHPQLVYLECEVDVLVRYFISWLLLKPKDVPYQVWVDEDDQGGRAFFYETFSGGLEMLHLGKDMKLPEEVIEKEVKKGVVEPIPLKFCQMIGCDLVAVRSILAKSGSSLNVCQKHSDSLQEQFLRAEERKLAKSKAKKEERKWGVVKKKG